MENGELCVTKTSIILQLQLSVNSLVHTLNIFIIQDLGHPVAEFGCTMFSVMAMNNQYLAAGIMDGVMFQLVVMMMMLELVV